MFELFVPSTRIPSENPIMTMLRMVIRLVGRVWIPAKLEAFNQHLGGAQQIADWCQDSIATSGIGEHSPWITAQLVFAKRVQLQVDRGRKRVVSGRDIDG